MKILKRPEHIIFDTEHPEKMEFNPSPKGLPAPLHQIVSPCTDFEYLSRYFKAKENVKHPIFSDFSNSFFYCVSV